MQNFKTFLAGQDVLQNELVSRWCAIASMSYWFIFEDLAQCIHAVLL